MYIDSCVNETFKNGFIKSSNSGGHSGGIIFY